MQNVHHHINSLEELQAAQDRLKVEMRSVGHEATRSASQATTGAGDFLLKNVLLPAGAFGLGVFMVKQAMDWRERRSAAAMPPARAVAATKQRASHWLPRLLLFAVPLVQQCLVKNKAEAEGQTVGGQSHATPPSALPAWLAFLVPMAMPVVRQLLSDDRVATRGTADGPASHVFFDSLVGLLPVALQQVFATTEHHPQKTPQP